MAKLQLPLGCEHVIFMNDINHYLSPSIINFQNDFSENHNNLYLNTHTLELFVVMINSFK